ncbi:hypothetical protein C9426_35290 [Serratia sp. S1B]|nr:hypothetical protein C9426_35290 [Serratia sp. S1B]
MTSRRMQALGEQLLQRGRAPAPSAVAVLPVNEMPMVLTLEQLRPNPDNPRTTRNPKYDEIKASIRARGLDSVPKVTKDPESMGDVYIFSDGGNTRYTILLELWEETQDERFRRIQCIFKPWPGRLQCVIGHLAENDVRGDLSFIEKSFGIAKARSIYEDQLGRGVSQRELAELLKTEGYPIHYSSISRMEYVIKHLYPYLPGLLESGLSRSQTIPLINLRMAAEKAWREFSAYSDVIESFDEIFGEVCRALDDPEHYTLETFKDELIAALLQAMPSPEITYDRWLIELDPKEQNRRKLFGEPAPLPQHILNAGQAPEKQVEEITSVVASSLTSSVSPVKNRQNGDDFSAANLPPKINQSSPVVTDTGSQQHTCVARKKEDQLDLYGNVSEARESTLPITFSLASDTVRPEKYSRQPDDVLESAAVNPFISFANTGLEPVTDIWHISTLQDDIDHLQDMAFRLAFELAEVLQAEQALCEDRTPNSVGYRVPVNIQQTLPITRLLAALAGDVAVSLSATELTNMVFGTEQSAHSPLLDDVLVVKLLRLIRVIRRLREIQRQSDQRQEVEGA